MAAVLSFAIQLLRPCTPFGNASSSDLSNSFFHELRRVLRIDRDSISSKGKTKQQQL